MRRLGAAAVRRALPDAVRPLAEALLAVAEEAELAVHLVGGPVRDLLLGRALRDVDLIVEPSRGRGARELARLAAPPGARVVSHDRFGTVKIEAGLASLDLATVRSERYRRPGALPEVAPGALAEDLERRDFTVNALAVPLTPAARAGRRAVIDPGRGLEDLEAGRLRVFHPRSFHDDPTRALRAARLAPRLGFSLSRGSRSALRAALRDGAFGAVSGERYHAELERLFRDPPLGLDPARALRRLDEWHVLPALEPGLGVPAPALAPLRRLGRLVAEPAWSARGRVRPWVAGFMLWLGPLETPLRRRALRRLAVRGEAARRIAAFPRWRDASLARLARERGRAATDARLAGTPEEELLALAAAAPANLRRRIVRFAAEDRHVALPIDGGDLVALGFEGPAVGRSLARVRAAVLDRAVSTREEALALAREVAHRGTPRAPGARGARGARGGRGGGRPL